MQAVDKLFIASKVTESASYLCLCLGTAPPTISMLARTRTQEAYVQYKNCQGSMKVPL